MKKNKHKAIVKESKSLAKKEIENQIVAALRSITIEFTSDRKKIEKLISKNAKQLAKKLSKSITLKAVEIKPPTAKPAKKSAKPKTVIQQEETPA